MDPYRLRLLVAPALASLFLILGLCAFVVLRPASVGMKVPKPRIQRHASWRECEDDMPIVVRIHKDGTTGINLTQERPDELAPTIARIMDYRETERAVYVMPDSDVSFGYFAGIYDKVVTSTTNLHVFLVTDHMRKLLSYNTPGTGIWGICDLEWPENGYKAENWYAQPTAPPEY
jgi:biopolymer transport protein ExbD